MVARADVYSQMDFLCEWIFPDTSSHSERNTNPQHQAGGQSTFHQTPELSTRTTMNSGGTTILWHQRHLEGRGPRLASAPGVHAGRSLTPRHMGGGALMYSVVVEDYVLS